MSQRKLSALALLLAAAAIFFWIGSNRMSESEEPQDSASFDRRERSVVLITIDTTRADRLASYGAEDVETPYMDRLAEQGIRFDQALSVAPITLVAHTSILTGLYPPEHGVRNNGTHHAGDELVLLSEILADRGYRTGGFVSAAVLERRYGLDQGFEVYDDDLSTGRERHPRMVADRPAEATVESATAWLDTIEDDERFFLWAHFYDPHAAYSPPPPYRDEYRGRLYDGEIAYMDSQIGRLLQHPKLRYEKDLVVTVIGDHGESLGEHGEQTHAILAYDSTLRVPWILWTPDAPTGRVFEPPVGQVDLVPTLLDLLDFEMPEDLPGRSLLPWIEGKTFSPRSLYSETFLPYYTYGWAKLQVLRQGDFKYIDAPKPELYDLSRDPFELTNLHEQQSGRAHDLHRQLEEYLETTDGGEREASLSLDSESIEKLRSLGYLSVGSTQPANDAERPDPKDVVDLHVGLERTRRLLSDRLFPQAVEEAKAILRRDPTNLAAMIDLAVALQGARDYDETVRVLERALSLDPDYTRLHVLLSEVESRRGNLEQALALIDSAIELDPVAVEQRLRKAQLLHRMEREEEAIQLLAATLLDDPENPRLLTARAQMIEMPQKRYEEAEATLRSAIERDPFLVAGYRNLGRLYELTSEPKRAVETYRQGLERRPDDADLHARLGALLARRSAGSEVERHLQEAIRLAEGPKPELHVSLGGWLADQGRLEDAQRQYEIALLHEPGNAAARNNRAIAYYRAGRVDEAVAELRDVIAKNPKYADALNNLAAVQVDLRDWQQAEDLSRRALGIDPSLPEGWNNLGVALDEQGEFEEARQAFEKSLELSPTYWRAKHNLGILLRKAGDPRAAVEALGEVLRDVPSHADTHLELGRLFAGPLADPKQARLHFNAFLRSAPNHPAAADIRTKLTEMPAQ